MGALVSYSPAGRGPGSIVRLVWTASLGLLTATRTGQRERAAVLGLWLTNTRADPRCTPHMRRTIDRALQIATGTFGGIPPAFEPLQPDDGAAA